jgi:hypothetical protein
MSTLMSVGGGQRRGVGRRGRRGEEPPGGDEAHLVPGADREHAGDELLEETPMPELRQSEHGRLGKRAHRLADPGDGGVDSEGPLAGRGEAGRSAAPDKASPDEHVIPSAARDLAGAPAISGQDPSLRSG